MSGEHSTECRLEDLLPVIRSARRVALIAHVTPDADCIGSIGALWLALPELGIAPEAVLPEGTVSRKMTHLAGYAGLRPASMDAVRRCDLALVLDTAKDRRVNVPGKLEALPETPVMNIDHHTTNTRFGRWNWVDASRSSTSEMVYELITALGCQVTPTIATLLYAGIHSDTQGFSLSNATPRSLAVGHSLAASGARVREVCERLHRSYSPGEFELLKTVYANTRLGAGGKLAWSTLSSQEIARSGCNANDIDDQVAVPRSIEGIAIAMLLSEAVPGKVRINFRGEGEVDVLRLAEQFGGGGHTASAGAMIDGDIGEVTARVVAAAEAYVSRL